MTQEELELIWELKNKLNQIIDIMNNKLVAREELQKYESVIDLKLNDIESRLSIIENKISDLETRVSNLENP